MRTDLRWWREDDPSTTLFSVIRKIQGEQGDRTEAMLTSLCLYDEWQALGFVLSGYEVRRTSIDERLSINVVRSCIDTVRAEIIQARPRPMFLTGGGDWSLRRKAERMGKFVEGVFGENAFDRGASLVALDALVTGLGAVHVVEDQGRVLLERVLPHEIWVDRRDGFYNAPRSLYVTRWVDRAVLRELYPEHKALVDEARDALDQQWRWTDSENDQVAVVEAWHLRSSDDSDDGRHVVCVSSGLLDEEPWEAPTFPFAFLKWKDPLSGFYPRGLADELRKTQRSINVACARIERGHELHTEPKIGLPRGSKINAGHFRAGAGLFVEFDGQPPVPIVFPAVSPEVYSWLDKLIERAYQISGVSQAASRSEKPSGVTSGRAIRLSADLQSRRFLDFARAWEQFYVDTSREIVRLMERLAEKDASYEVAYTSKRGQERIKWTDVKLDEGSYALQVWPTSLLPSTPQGKLEAVSDLVNTGFADRLGIPPEQVLKLLDFPDTEAAFGTVTASWDLVEQILEEMLDGGEYTPPEPFYNLSLCVLIAVRHYQQWRLWKVPEDRMELLRQWINDCKALIDLANPPAPPPAPPGPMPPEPAPPAPPGLPPMEMPA